MTQRKIRLGIIGAGAIAQKHLEVITANERCSTVGIYSRTLAKAGQLARAFDIPLCASSIEELIEKARPEALLILVSVDQTYAVVKDVLRYGIPLLIEKPAGLTPQENLELAELAREKGVATMVAFNRRFYSIFHKGLDIIRRNGRLLGIAVQGHERFWKILQAGKTQGHVMDQWIFANSTHTIDLLRFFGGEIKQISAYQLGLKQRNGDQFAAAMEFNNGCLGTYQSHWFSPGGWRVVLYGEGVTVEFNPLEQGRWTDQAFVSHEILPDEVDVKYKPGFYAQLNAFLDLVSEGQVKWPALDLRGALQTMELAGEISS